MFAFFIRDFALATDLAADRMLVENRHRKVKGACREKLGEGIDRCAEGALRFMRRKHGESRGKGVIEEITSQLISSAVLRTLNHGFHLYLDLQWLSGSMVVTQARRIFEPDAFPFPDSATVPNIRRFLLSRSRSII